MSDVIKQALITNVFWLTLFLVSVLAFRKPLAAVIGSLGKFNIAGASFELRATASALESSVLLANVLIDVLSERKSAEKFHDFVSQASVVQLVRFIQKYVAEVPKENQNVEMLKNVALLVGRKKQYQVAIRLYDELLKTYPGDPDLLYLKARMLRDGGNARGAEEIYDELLPKTPANSGVWFGLARTKSLLQKFDESLNALEKAIELGYWKNTPKMLVDSQLEPLRKAEPVRFEEMRALLAKRSAPSLDGF
jgi:tetratricopeptide (TPR) repeat protein